MGLNIGRAVFFLVFSFGFCSADGAETRFRKSRAAIPHGQLIHGLDASNPLFDNLVLCEDMSDETDATDNKYTMTNNNTVTFSTGLIGNIGRFVDDSSQYLSRADNNDLSVNGDYSVSVWANMDTMDTTGQTLVAKRASSGCEYAINHIDSGPTEKFVVQLATTSGGGCSFFQTLDSSDLNNIRGVWKHIVWRYRSTDRFTDLWVNNVQEDSDTAEAALTDGTTAFTIGAMATPTFYFDGDIDSVMVFKRFLPDKDISSLFNIGRGIECP